MLKMIGQLKPIMLLIAVVGLQLPLHADTNQLRFDSNAIKDPGSLAVKLQDTRAAVSQSITAKLSDKTQLLLTKYDGISTPSPALQKALLADLNRLLQTGALYDAQTFADIELSEQTQALIAQNPQNGEALVRLNYCLLADAYPYELKRSLKPLKGIEACRENLRQIKLALDNYRIANANTDPQWLSELSPEYLDKKVLLCPADVTTGDVLTEGASDPMLPCSYLYESRSKIEMDILRMQEGDMTPIVRCEHHRLNLSAGGKLYRNGPQRGIYTSNKTGFSVLDDFIQNLRAQHGEAFLKTQAGRQELKQATEELIIKQFVPKMLSAFAKEVYTQLETHLGKTILNTAGAVDLLQQATVQMRDQIGEQLHSELEARLGAEFLETAEGQEIHQQLSVLIDAFSLDGR